MRPYLVSAARTIVTTLAVVGSSYVAFSAAQGHAQQATLATRFQPQHSLPQVVVAPAQLAERLSGRTAISLAAGSFYRNSTTSLATGYGIAGGGAIAVQRGALQPRQGDASNIAPFEESATFVDIGMRPDILESADLNGDGLADLVVASFGGSSLRILLGDGNGGFHLQAPVPVHGSIASLSVWRNNGADLIAVGICSHSCSVDLYKQDGTRLASLPMHDRPTVLQAARLNGGPNPDLIVAGTSGIWVIDGKSVLTSNPHMDALSVANAAAVDTGNFVYDRRGMPQVAVLSADGALHIFARQGVLSAPAIPPANIRQLIRQHALVQTAAVKPGTLSWYEAETLHNVAVLSNNAAPILLRSRVSGSGMDDLLILNAAGGNTVTVRHPVVAYLKTSTDPHAGTVQPLAARVERETTSPGTVLAALPMRITQDSRLGLITASGQSTPEASGPTVSKTYNVNTTADQTVPGGTNPCTNGGSCTLRDAIAQVDADAETNETNGTQDAVDIPGGTYVLQNDGTADQFGNLGYHIEIYGPVNLVGSGANTTIITAGGNDRIFSENSGNPTVVNNAQPPIDVSLSNLTLSNGADPSTANSPTQDLGGGLMDSDTGGTGNITFTNVTLTGGSNAVGYGGALSVTDQLLSVFTGGTVGNGLLTMTNSSVTSNSDDETGGGISAGPFTGDVPVDIENSTFSGNTVNGTLNGTSDDSPAGEGGALYIAPTNDITLQSKVIGCSFTGNSARNGTSSEGGAIWSGPGSVVTNNVFTTNSVTGALDNGEPSGGLGGGLYILANQFSPVITGNKFENNTATQDGGGVWLFADNNSNDGFSSDTSTVTYNVFTGNTATASGRTGLAVSNYTGANVSDSNATVTATDNFWGCNGAAAGTGCDTAPPNGGGGLTVTPYAVVSASLNTTSPATGDTITLTGGITTDSNGTLLGTSNLAAFTGLPATLTISEGGNTLNSATNSTNSSARTALSATVTSGSGNGTFKIANATINENFASATSTSLMLSASPTFTHVGQQVTFTATLSPYTANGGSSNGETITFNFTSPDGFMATGTAPLTNGVATFHNPNLDAGYNTVTASYAGDATLGKSTSNQVSYPVLTTVSLTAPSGTSVTTNTLTTLQVMVAAATSDGGASTPTGTIDIIDNANGAQVGTCMLTGGACLISVANAELPAQTLTLQANYINGNYANSTSVPLTLVVTNPNPTPSAMTSPGAGTTLSGASQTFTWSAGSGVEWQLLVGNSVGAENYFHTNAQFTTSASVTGLPNNGTKVYVRLLYRVNDAWKSIDYTYTASSPTPAAASITSPGPSTQLSGPSITFFWTAEPGNTQNQLYIGTRVGASNFFSSGQLYNATSKTVTGLPTAGQTIYVRLWSYISGAWQYKDYTYTEASSPVPSISPKPE